MGYFNKSKSSNKVENLAGGSAFSRPPKEELVFAVLSTLLKDKYYEGAEDRVARIGALCAEVGPEFVARLAVFARREFHLRSVFHLLVEWLAVNGKEYVRDVIIEGTERPDDLTEIAAAVGKPMPKQVKRGIRRALYKFDRYQLAKYKTENKEYKLIDLFNLVHPKPEFASDEQKVAWKDLVDGNLKSFDTWETRLSAGEDKKKVWHDLLAEDKLGYMALLRNLRNIEEQADPETIDLAAVKIADKARVEKSKQLPFRFVTAFDNIHNQKLMQAVAQACEYSVANVPELPGKTLVAVDTSGSMSGTPITLASYLAAALIKKSGLNVTTVLYSDTAFKLNVLTSDAMITIAKTIQAEAIYGGTDTGSVFRGATQEKAAFDRIIILSDQESWQDYRGNLQQNYSEYKKVVGCNPYVYAIDIEGYGTSDIQSERVHHLIGWSDKILSYVSSAERKDQLIKDIEVYEYKRKES